MSARTPATGSLPSPVTNGIRWEQGKLEDEHRAHDSASVVRIQVSPRICSEICPAVARVARLDPTSLVLFRPSSAPPAGRQTKILVALDSER
jgi:hypothetical protein